MTKRTLDADKSMKEKKQKPNEIKWIRICMGEKGNRLFPQHCSKLCEAMIEDSITYCISNCNHPQDTNNTVFLPLSNITVQEMECFLIILETITNYKKQENKESIDSTKNADNNTEGDVDNNAEDDKKSDTDDDDDDDPERKKKKLKVDNSNVSERINTNLTIDQEARLNQYVYELKVNYHSVLRCFNFFGTDTLCNSFLMFKLSNPRYMPYGINLFTAWQLTKKDYPHGTMRVFYEESIPLLERLDYISFHHDGDWISFCETRDPNSVAQQLGIETEFVSMLKTNECVIAGGASMYIACPWTKFTERCDVDFFVLGSDSVWQYYLDRFINLCDKTQRQLYVNGHSVLTAIGTFGVRRLQLIYSDSEDQFDLIREFDLSPVQCCYDGILLNGTMNAQRDWLTKTCHLFTLRSVQAKRLYGIQWKGFALEKEVELFLQHSEMADVQKQLQFEFEIPNVSLSIPKKVQDALLYAQCKWEPYGSQKLQPFSQSRYSNQPNIWHDMNKLEEYVNQFCDMSTFSTKKGVLEYWTLDSNFSLEIKHCRIEIVETEDRGSKDFKFAYLQDVAPFLCEKLRATCTELFLKKWMQKNKNNDNVKWERWFTLMPTLTYDTKLYKNGIQIWNTKEEYIKWEQLSVSREDEFTYRTNYYGTKNLYAKKNVRVLLKPYHFYKGSVEIGADKDVMRLRWKLDSIFC